MKKPSSCCVAVGILIFTGAWAAAPSTTTNTTNSWCRPTNDLTAQRFLHQMLELATSDDSRTAQARAALDDMPEANSSEVWLVSNDSLCHRASAALDSSLYTTPRGYPLYLAHVGVLYVAFPPG